MTPRKTVTGKIKVKSFIVSLIIPSAKKN